MFTVPMGC